MKKILLVLLSIIMFSDILGASTKEDVKEYFDKKLTNILKIIEQNNNNKELRNELIINELDNIFDFELMGKLALGKKWRTLSKDKREEFIKLYIKRMQDSYSAKLDNYKDQKVQIVGISQPKRNRIVISTDIISNTDRYNVQYKFYKPKKSKPGKYDWLIYDVTIMGVSILKTDRAQFKEYLSTHSFDQLLQTMRN